MSRNAWLYVLANPVNYTDPTGHEPMRRGYLEGISFAAGLGQGDISGAEIVYDYATMTRARFTYQGTVGGLFASIGWAAYVGQIMGFNYERPIPTGLNWEMPRSQLILKDYSGPFDGVYTGVSATLIKPIVGITVGAGYFQSSGGSIKGVFSYLSGGVGLLPFEVVGFHTIYSVDHRSLPGYENSGIEYYYDPKTGQVNRSKLISDIFSGDNSPILGVFSPLAGLVGMIGSQRSGQIVTVMIAAHLFEEYYHPYLAQYITCWPTYITTP